MTEKLFTGTLNHNKKKKKKKKKRTAPDVTQNTASHLGLFFLLTKLSLKNEIKNKVTPDAHLNENGLIQMIRMGKLIWLI